MFFAKPLQRSNLCASHRQRRWLTHGELPAAEIILTFAVDALINHLAASPAYIKAVSPLELTQPKIEELIQLKNGAGGRALVQRVLRERSGRPGSLLTLAPHRSGRAGSAASGSSTDGFATRRRVPAGPGSQAMATAIPKAYLASSAIRCRDVETGPTLGVLAVFPSTGATCRCPLPSTGSRGLNSPASAVL